MKKTLQYILASLSLLALAQTDALASTPPTTSTTKSVESTCIPPNTIYIRGRLRTVGVGIYECRSHHGVCYIIYTADDRLKQSTVNLYEENDVDIEKVETIEELNTIPHQTIEITSYKTETNGDVITTYFEEAE